MTTSYVPINSALFAAVFSGALGGIGAGLRTPTDTNSASATNVALVAVAGAFAQEFDTVWNSATPLDSATLHSAESLALGYFSGSAQPSLTSGPTSFPKIIPALIALLTAGQAYYTQPANGAAVAVADADATLTYAQGALRTVAARTATRTYRLSDANVPTGARITITVESNDAHTVEFLDDTGGFFLMTVPSNAQGTLIAQFDGTRWFAVGIGASAGVAP